MQTTETQEQMLRGVLDQLMTSYSASAEELSATHAYLFGEQPMAPFFTDKELFETVHYLRETIVSYQLANLGALAHYYEKRKQEMRDYLAAIATDDETAEANDNSAVSPNYIRIAETLALMPSEIDRITKEVKNESGRFFEQWYSNIIQLFTSAPLPAGGEKDIHLAVKRHVRESAFPNLPVSMQLKTSMTALPDGIQYYMEQFASHFNGGWIVMMQFAHQMAGHSHLPDRSFGPSFSSICNSTFERYFYGGHLPDYTAIMNVLRQEQPIIDSHFKIRVTEWLVYSKMIFSESPNREPQDNIPACLDLSLKHLFQTAPVRLYGGSNMQGWIQNLFETKLSAKRWMILRRRPGHFWLTSDNPGFLININDLQGDFTEVAPRHSLLDIRPDSVLYYPLSKEYCLKLEPQVEALDERIEDMPIQYSTPSDEELDFVNGVTVSTYKKVVITNQRTTLQQIQCNHMAKNGKVGDGHRDGQVTDRSQTHNPKNDKWVKRDTDTGRFIDQKADDKPFKGVRKEK